MINFYQNLENHEAGQTDRGKYEADCAELDR
jgi:hypothetical protein